MLLICVKCYTDIQSQRTLEITMLTTLSLVGGSLALILIALIWVLGR